MKTNTINKAEGGYAFNTLWQEITNGVGHITSAIVNGLQVTERTKQIKEFLKFKNQEIMNEWSLNLISTTKGKGDAGFYIAMILLVVLLGGGLVFAVKQSK